MSKVIRFSQKFPGYHPRAGEPTYFVEQVLNWYYETHEHELIGSGVEDMIFLLNPGKDSEMLKKFVADLNMDIEGWKSHTVRGGERFKAGDLASLRVWSGRPYHTTDITILPDIKIHKTWPIRKDNNGILMMRDLNENHFISEIAQNDGLSLKDFNAWFNKPFDGQIINWNEVLDY